MICELKKYLKGDDHVCLKQKLLYCFHFLPIYFCGAKNCHFKLWLGHAESTELNSVVLKNTQREDLLLLMAFCFGFLPQDELCEKLDRDYPKDI